MSMTKSKWMPWQDRTKPVHVKSVNGTIHVASHGAYSAACCNARSLVAYPLHHDAVNRAHPETFCKKCKALEFRDHIQKQQIKEEYTTLKEDAPTNCIGAGAIEGAGVGDKGEPGFTKKQQLKHKAKNLLRRKLQG